jgi:hypothetical protein
MTGGRTPNNNKTTGVAYEESLNKSKTALPVFHLIIDSFDCAIHVLIKHFFIKKLYFH